MPRGPLHPFYPSRDGRVRVVPTPWICVREVGEGGLLGPELPQPAQAQMEREQELAVCAAYRQLIRVYSPRDAIAAAFTNVHGTVTREQDEALAAHFGEP